MREVIFRNIRRRAGKVSARGGRASRGHEQANTLGERAYPKNHLPE